MGIELLIVLLIPAGLLAFWYFNRDVKSTDLNNDGKTDVSDLAVAVENTVAGAKVVAKKAKATAKKATTKTKAAAAKTTAAPKKPKAPKK